MTDQIQTESAPPPRKGLTRWLQQLGGRNAGIPTVR
jgi:hypothetical protein